MKNQSFTGILTELTYLSIHSIHTRVRARMAESLKAIRQICQECGYLYECKRNKSVRIG